MPIASFPPHESADSDGLLALGGDLSIESLLLAYSNGIFPWPVCDETLTWFSPPTRTLLFLDEFHIPRSLEKARRALNVRFTIDTATADVIRKCSSVENRFDSRGRPQDGTWITSDIVDAYMEFARAGFVHSVECWNESSLVGGLYGVSLGGMFAGESMFYEQANASKLALCFLVDFLRECGAPWIDCQVMTPLFKSFGAREVGRDEFLKLLIKALSREPPLFVRSRN